MLKYFVLFFIFFGTCGYAQTPEASNHTIKKNITENNNLSNLIDLHPNPVTDFLKIKSKGLTLTKIEIYSILGGKVKEIDPKSKSIYLGDLPRGIYLIKIYSEKGYTVKKLIKK